MPPKAKTTCREEGCSNPRYIYPTSGMAVYCAEHLHLRKSARKGEDLMTGPMRDVLHYLLDAKRRDFPFQELHYPLAHGRTLRRLLDRDWIFASEAIDGMRYCITYRGEEMLAYYDTMINRRDGRCPICGNERHVRSSGQRDAYYIDCLRARGRQKRVDNKDLGDIHRPCSRCHKQKRHQYPNGKYSTYCKHCERVNRRRNARKQRRKLMKAVLAGAPVPLCQICKQQPRRVFINSISNYCDACRPTYMRKMKLKRRLSAHMIYFAGKSRCQHNNSPSKYRMNSCKNCNRQPINAA